MSCSGGDYQVRDVFNGGVPNTGGVFYGATGFPYKSQGTAYETVQESQRRY